MSGKKRGGPNLGGSNRPRSYPSDSSKRKKKMEQEVLLQEQEGALLKHFKLLSLGLWGTFQWSGATSTASRESNKEDASDVMQENSSCVSNDVKSLSSESKQSSTDDKSSVNQDTISISFL